MLERYRGEIERLCVPVQVVNPKKSDGAGVAGPRGFETGTTSSAGCVGTAIDSGDWLWLRDL